MTTGYQIKEQDKLYFVTLQVIEWIDIFNRETYRKIIVENLEYCIKNKGLEIYAYCIMHSHIHVMCKATNGFILSDVMRDFKKYTSKKIIQTIMEEPESRREWLLAYFEKACTHLKRDQSYKVCFAN